MRERVRDEKQRERERESGGSDAEQGKQRREAVNIGSCMQWRAEESGRQIDSSRQ